MVRGHCSKRTVHKWVKEALCWEDEIFNSKRHGWHGGSVQSKASRYGGDARVDQSVNAWLRSMST